MRMRLAASITTLWLAATSTALAQPEPPPPLSDIKPGKPWTYVMGKGVMALAAVMLVGLVLGYLVKARGFRANLKRGGSK